jgi:hypothetical protein
MTASKDEQALIGAWRLMRFEEVGPGFRRYPMGPHVDGRITYDAEGNMTAALVNMDRTNLKDGDWRKAAPEEKIGLFGTYMGYFGTYVVDPGERTVTHHVVAGSLPQLTGSKQVRHYRLDGDSLFLTSRSGEVETQVDWQRVK